MGDAGLKMAVVSNFDLRLRPLLEALGLDQLFDALIISAEVRASPTFALHCQSVRKEISCFHQDCPRGFTRGPVEGNVKLCMLSLGWCCHDVSALLRWRLRSPTRQSSKLRLTL